MPRPKNPDTTTSILDASWHLFNERGYNRTSYAAIADKAGVSQPLVQKYFPSKDTLAIDNLARVRFATDQEVRASFPKVTDPLERGFLLAQIYVAALMSSDESRRFFKDILRDRELTRATITNDTMWTIDYIDATALRDENQIEVVEEATAALGALYETMYFCITTEKDMDINLRLQPCFVNLYRLSGRPTGESLRIAEKCKIKEKTLKELGQKVYQQALKSTWSDSFLE